MRFAGDLINEGGILSETGPIRRHFENLLNRPKGIGVDSSSFEMTPELTPSPDMYQGPGFDQIRDNYIRTQPASGITTLPGISQQIGYIPAPFIYN